MLAGDGCLVHGSMRKARSLSNGDAYSAVKITVAASGYFQACEGYGYGCGDQP